MVLDSGPLSQLVSNPTDIFFRQHISSPASSNTSPKTVLHPSLNPSACFGVFFRRDLQRCERNFEYYFLSP